MKLLIPLLLLSGCAMLGTDLVNDAEACAAGHASTAIADVDNLVSVNVTGAAVLADLSVLGVNYGIPVAVCSAEAWLNQAGPAASTGLAKIKADAVRSYVKAHTASK